MKTLAELIESAPKGARVMWGTLCTRWHVYPRPQPTVLVAHSWRGYHSPQPDGTWFLTPVSYNLSCEVVPADSGEWVRTGTIEAFHKR